MSLIDIKAVKAEAGLEISNERAKKAKDALVRQMRSVATAEDVLRGEKKKLEDIEQQIEDGTF